MTRKCFTKKHVEDAYSKRPAGYRLAMNRARVSESSTGICFDTASEGWKEALRIAESVKVKNLTPKIIKRVVHNTTRAVQSVVKTGIGIDLATLEMQSARIFECSICPHVTRHSDGSIYTCGPMLKGLISEGKKPCGCVLSKKVRDIKQDCPMGYWPKVVLPVIQPERNQHDSEKRER